jgi:hypothetical protein
MDTNTTHDQTKQQSMEHTRDSTLAQVTVLYTTPDSVTEVFEIVSGNRYSTPMTVLTCSQNELASMILSHLTIKDLTRALSVSKRWQQVILGTVELRQTLFLTPKHSVKEYLDYEQETDPEGRAVDTITRESSESSRSCLIVETHPVLKVAQSQTTHLSTHQPYAKLKTAPPSTFLTQPPIARFVICHRKIRYDVEREAGVTFGDVVSEFEKLHAMHDRKIFDRGDVNQFLARFGKFPGDFKVNWDDDNIEHGSELRQTDDGSDDDEFAKFRLLTSQKYDTLISGVENWYRFVANSLECVQAARKKLADA